MLLTSICAVTEEFSRCSRSISIFPLKFVNLPRVVRRNWCTLKPIVDPDGSNLYVSLADATYAQPAMITAAVRLGAHEFIMSFLGNRRCNVANEVREARRATSRTFCRDCPHGQTR